MHENGINNSSSEKNQDIEGNPSVIFMFRCDLRGTNQAQVKEGPHTSALEELLRCIAVKGTQSQYWEPCL